jgi:gliding motility-associated-like protein
MLKFFTKLCLFIILVSLSSSLYGQINANFSTNINTGCTPVLIQFTDLSTSTASGIASWQWDFGDNTTTGIQNPAKVFNTAGLFTTCLIVTDSLGNSDTLCLVDLIDVASSPTAEFSSVPSTGCAPVDVQFTDMSTAGSNPINSWQWSFGTGASSNLQNPQFIYNNINSYTVSLTVTDQNGCSDQVVKSGHVSVSGIPTAGFTTATTQYCSFPATVNLANTTNVPSGAEMKYQWYFGDGDSSSVQSPTHIYANPGLYDVMLISTDTSSTSNCSDTILISDYIEVFSNNNLAFAHSPTQGCDQVNVQFTNTTACPSTNWSWDFGDNTTSTQENPSHTYSAAGTYDVIFTAIVDGVTLSDTCINCVTVNITPTADYTTTGTIATCFLPITASFVGTSNNPNAIYLWDFGDNTTATAQNPSHTWTESGTYPVSLTVTSPEGCSKVIVKDTVFARPITESYIENRVSSCIGGEIQFLDSTASFYPITSWNWDFEDTTSTDQNPTITFSDTGSYNVTLIVTNSLGCIDTFTNVAEVGDSLIIGFNANDTVVCIDQDIDFTNLTAAAAAGLVSEWSWDFGDGGSSSQFEPTYAYSDTGTYTVILTATYNNCDSELEFVDYITVGPPEADFEADRDCAAPLQVTFIDKSIGADIYSWDFGVPSMTDDTSNLANPSYTYPNSGTYTITLTAINSTTGCSHESVKTLILNSAEDVVVTLSDTAGCTPLSISVSNTSSLATYSWIAEGAIVNDSTLAQPTITYNTAGTYDSITLVVTHPTGCIEEIVLPDTIRTSTLIVGLNASTTSGCIPLSVNFTDQSFATNPVTSYIWDFGNGDSATTQNPNYDYITTGSFQPTLTVTDDVGCSQMANLSSSIIPTAPNVNFLSDTVACVDQEISFANLSTGIGLSHSWNFGDMMTSTQINPTHTYTTEGVYSACLTITDINGCSNTFCRTITIANPVSAFSANNTTSNCQALSVQFQDNSQNAISWFWDFGDSTTSTIQNPVKVYSQPGSYDVCLIITNQSGCKDTLCQPGFIQISGPSVDFSFTPDAGCPGTVVDFIATGQNVSKFIWVWGDFTTTEILGTSGNDTVTISHTYNNGGNIIPALVVEDISGCQLTFLASDTISIEDFSIDIQKSVSTLCDSGNVQLSASITSLTPVTSMTWTYGNPAQTSTNSTVNVNITTPGVYTISITASNASCTRTVSDSIIIYNSPNAYFGLTPQQACEPQLVTFTDSSTVLNDTIMSYVWSLGNTIMDSVQNTSYLYDTAGSYNVQLKVTSLSGCSDSSIQILTIFPNPTADAGVDTTICEGDSYQLQASGGTVYVWNAAASLSCTNCANPIASPTVTTDYIVTVTSLDGCIDVDTVTINVNSKPVAAIANLPITECDGATVGLTDASTIASGNIINWNWDFGNAITSTMQNPTATYTIPSNYTVTLVATSDFGCSDTTTGQVIINQSPTATANFDTFICQGDSTTLIAGGGASYLWSNGGTLNCDTCAIVVANPSVTTTYTVTATAANGCIDTDTVRVDVSLFPNPILILSNDTTICTGDVIQLFASGGTSVLDYDWDMSSAGLSCYENCNNPFASPTVTTKYYVTLTGPGGCSTTDSVTVTVITPNSDVIGITDQTICEGDSIQIPTILGTNHIWSPFQGLSCVLCPDPIAFPSTTSTYSVTAEANGCFVTDEIRITVIDPSTFSAGDDVGLCPGQSIELNATGAGTVIWSPANTLSDANILNPIATPTSSTDYILNIDNGTCIITDTVSVIIIEEAFLEVEDIEICEGESVVLPVNALADDFLWTPAIGLSSDTAQNPIASPTETTTYTLTANLNGCNSTTKDLKVTVFPLPTISGFSVQEVFPGLSTDIELDVEFSPVFDYLWSTSLGNQLLDCTNCPAVRLIQPTEDMTVYVQATSLEGCTAQDSISIRITNDCDDNFIVLPNSFTPNGDGLNDILYVRGSGLIDIITFKVFSRSGEMVFSSGDKDTGWDGTFNGRELNTGVFVYYVEATCPVTGNVTRKQGNVMLIKN